MVFVEVSDKSESSSSSDDERDMQQHKNNLESKKVVGAGDKSSNKLLEGRIIRKQTVPTKPNTPRLTNANTVFLY